MSLRDRLLGRQNGTSPTEAVALEPAKVAEEEAASKAANTTRQTTMTSASGMYGRRIEHESLSALDKVKIDLHRQLIERLDLEALEQINDERLVHAEIRSVVVELLRGEPTPLTVADREDIIEHVLYEITGLGPIEPLFRDPTISDILVNGSKEIFVERHGRLSRVAATFRNDAHVLAVIDRIVSRVGRRVDESSPMVDARLPDGSRVNAIIPPLAIDGPVLSIRRFGAGLTVQKLIENESLTDAMAELIAACVGARLNILVSGGTGSGKTTLLNAMASFIPADQRIITIEDAAELRLQQEHVVRLETRPPNAEGEGEVAARDLVKNALRMRPDRIIVGEVRAGEALDMLQAMNTGHEGSLTTIHANSPRDALSRLETMILMAGSNLPDRAMREQISSALDLVIQVSRLADGTRKVVSIVEITGMEGPVTATQEIYRFRKKGIGTDGAVNGVYEATGVRPVFMERIAIAGITLQSDMFSDGGMR
jgi:pilus assembly protein CpaF